MKTAFNFLSKISLKKGFHFSKSHGSLVQDQILQQFSKFLKIGELFNVTLNFLMYF